ncbi:hypothetical protein BXU11_11740 [Flavobacterium sp. LM5]|nr:hypothetical protein BXU11_11740 [Flavobacterium sp. LM5]
MPALFIFIPIPNAIPLQNSYSPDFTEFPLCNTVFSERYSNQKNKDTNIIGVNTFVQLKTMSFLVNLCNSCLLFFQSPKNKKT